MGRNNERVASEVYHHVEKFQIYDPLKSTRVLRSTQNIKIMKNDDSRVRCFNDFINANSTVTLQSRAYFDSLANNRNCKVEPRCNSGSKERDKLPESIVQFPGRNTKQMDYVKEVEEWDKQTKRGGWCEGNQAKTSIQKNARSSSSEDRA